MKPRSEQHRQRLAVALRSNLRRRKVATNSAQRSRPAKHHEQVAREEKMRADPPAEA